MATLWSAAVLLLAYAALTAIGIDDRCFDYCPGGPVPSAPPMMRTATFVTAFFLYWARILFLIRPWRP
jgi:hypothetical protein